MNIRVLILLSSIFFLISCAQIVPLTGGEKDIESPKELESTPKNGSLNFAEKEITVEFDEFIQLQNLQSQFLVSPLMEEKPEVVVKGKKLVIKLQDTLQPNTTYSLNFGEAIVDITENNPIPNYKYVFSTGNYLDSLTYSGTVVNAFDLTPKEKTFVLLYNQFEDSVPYKELPRYVSITDKEGKFSISNIANGTYKVFAISDINSNYLFDLPNEEIAFLDTAIQIETNKAGDLLYAFEEDNVQQYVVKSENKTYSKISLILNKATEDLNIETLSDDLPDNWGIIDRNTTNDSITIWLTQRLEIDRLALVVGDSGGVIDTVTISLMSDKKFEETTLSINTNVSSSFHLNQPIIIRVNRPTTIQNLDSILLLEDSVEVNINIQKLDSINKNFKIDYPFKENTNYRLLIPSNAFQDYFGLSNDTLISDFKTKSISDYGTIALTVTPNFNAPYIVQLMKNNKIVRENYAEGEKIINYEYLQPANYELKLIVDNNNDQKWTTGLYLDNRQPEKVIYYEKPITLKPNWDNEINWIIKE